MSHSKITACRGRGLHREIKKGWKVKPSAVALCPITVKLQWPPNLDIWSGITMRQYSKHTQSRNTGWKQPRFCPTSKLKWGGTLAPWSSKSPMMSDSAALLIQPVAQLWSGDRKRNMDTKTDVSHEPLTGSIQRVQWAHRPSSAAKSSRVSFSHPHTVRQQQPLTSAHTFIRASLIFVTSLNGFL